MEKIAELVKTGKATVVDVRTPGEFQGGHVKGSINIPLQKVPERLIEIKAMKNVVLCCASGGRSAQAAMYLKNHGVECQDGGSWQDVDCYC
jgi:phage shock protein E